MTLHRSPQDRSISFECDECHEVFITSTDDFSQALDEAKADGWTPHEIEPRVWTHTCSHCD
jgi:hypothetical protein